MSRFLVSSRQLRQRASELESLNREFSSSVRQLASYEQQLAGQWKGDAQRAFHQAFTHDQQQFESFRMGITEYVQALRQAADEYDRAEDQNVSIARTRK